MVKFNHHSRLPLAISIALTACSSSGKSHRPPDLLTFDNLAPHYRTSDGSCDFTSDPLQGSASDPAILDLALSNEYTTTILVTNGSSPIDDPGQNYESIQIQSAHVSVSDADGGALGEFTTPATGALVAQSASSQAFAPVSFTLLSSNFTNVNPCEGCTVVLDTQYTLTGTTQDGNSITSNEGWRRVGLCVGCLIDFPPVDVDPTYPAPNCVAGKMRSPLPPVPCVRGQDLVVDCADCLDVPACWGKAAPGSVSDAGPG